MNGLAQGLIIAAFTIVVGAIIAFLKSMSDRLQKLEIEFAKLDTQVSPLWAKVQAQIAADLHHPEDRYREMDRLLEKLEAMSISNPERDRLKDLLLERSLDMHADISDDQRAKAKLMIGVMDMVLTEASNNSNSPPPLILAKTPVAEGGTITIILEPTAPAPK